MDFDVHIGTREYWNQEIPYGLLRDDRRRHMFLVGQTGVGKSTLLRSIIAQDIARGDGCALIDPHGDLAQDVLRDIPRNRINDVVWFDPADTDHVVGFNPFYQVPKDERALAAANIAAAMKHIWHDSWGPRLERILIQTCRALLDAPRHLEPSMLSIPLMFVEERYRNAVIARSQDHEVRRFFEQLLANWTHKQLLEYIESTDNKISQFISNPFTRNILGQYRPSIDLADIMANQKILIISLPKGILGEQSANLMGSLLASGIQQTAMRRAAVPKTDRPDFHFHIDEFHNYTSNTFASALSEVRKFNLSLTFAAQYLDQITPTVRAAIFGNVGNLIAFRVSAGDAQHLADEIPEFVPSVFRDLATGTVIARILFEGNVRPPCRLSTEPPTDRGRDHSAKILDESRQRYATPRAVVEPRLARTLRTQLRQ